MTATKTYRATIGIDFPGKRYEAGQKVPASLAEKPKNRWLLNQGHIVKDPK